MSDFKIADSIYEPKKRLKYRLYHSRCNVIKKDSSSAERYYLHLNSFADNNRTLIQILELFSSSIFEIDVTKYKFGGEIPKLNKIFVFMIDLYFLYHNYVPHQHKRTEEELRNQTEIVGYHEMDPNVKQVMNSQIKTCKTNVQSLFKKYKSQYTDNIAVISAIEAILIEKYTQQILSIEQSEQEQLQQLQFYYPKAFKDSPDQYLKKVMQGIRDMQFTKKIFCQNSMRQFIINYSNYYKVERAKVMNPNTPQIPPKQGYFIKSLLIQRYTQGINSRQLPARDEILLNLKDLMKLRRNHVNQKEYFLVIKNLMRQLRTHLKQTKRHYPMLSPQDILFNQFTLQIQLSYQKPLLGALGLLKRPTNTELKISLIATPLPYDLFSSPYEMLGDKELDKDDIFVNQIMYNLAYESSDEIVSNQPSINNIPISLLRQKYMKESEGWRLLMIAAYLMNGKQYYKMKGKQIKTKQQFKQFLKAQQGLLQDQNNSRYIFQILGTKFQELVNRPFYNPVFSPGIQMFEEMLGETVDSAIEQTKFKKKDILRQRQFVLMNQLIAFFIKSPHFKKTFNTTKYLLNFYLDLYYQYFQIIVTCRYLSNWPQKSEAFPTKIIDSYANKRKQSSFIQQAYLKFQDYRKRHSKGMRQDQIQYLLKCSEYEHVDRHYKHLADVFQKFTNIANKFDQGQFKGDVVRQARQIFKNVYQQMKMVKECIISIVNQRILISLGKSQEGKCLSLMIKVATLTFVLINEQNLAHFQSLLLPLVNLQYKNENPIDGKMTDVYIYALQILKQQQQKQSQNQIKAIGLYQFKG